MPVGHDTIAALATARGQSALAVIRMSGPRAIQIAAESFSGASLTEAPSHTVHVGSVRSRTGDVVDQVVVTLFRSPRSVTGEDIVEISCHGGDVASRLILERLVGLGARPAAPGEFTQRAFLNGKMDLAQAESVGELIHARSVRAHKVSVAHLTGRYSEMIDRFRNELLDLVAFLELELDFGEEDVEFADRDRLARAFVDGRTLLEELLASYRYGRTLTDGIRVAIAGRPNAGKSTFLNVVLGDDRAIVSDVAGTTRDAIEAESVYEGFRLIWIDTAGLRETTDAIEKEGVERARRMVDQADVLVYVYALDVGLSPEEQAFLSGLEDTPTVIVANKVDLLDDAAGVAPSHVALSAERLRAERRLPDAVLERVLAAALGSSAAADEHRTVTSARHVSHFQQALQAVVRAEQAFERGASGDMLVEDLRRAMDELGLVTGALTNEDVLDRIFSRFCIGK